MKTEPTRGVVLVAEKKEPIPSAKVKAEVESILRQPLTNEAKLKVMLRIYRREQSAKSRSEANMNYLRSHILELSGGSFEAIAASVFTQGYCTETAYYLQGEKAEAAFLKLEDLLSESLTRQERRAIFRIEEVPFLKVDWSALRRMQPKLYAKARKIVGTYLSLTVQPLAKKTREGK